MHLGQLGYAQMAPKWASRNLVSFTAGLLASPLRHRRAMDMRISLSEALTDWREIIEAHAGTHG
jgi:hypothetical protein